MLLNLLFILLPSCLGSSVREESYLELVHVLFRHGARTPINPYPNDPNMGQWPQGSGQLTNEGKRNQLELGRYLRKRYTGYLPEEYHLNYTHVESTDVDRTLMSAEANLAGLYPPQGDDVWDPQLAWQPIPVHTRPVQDDYKLKSYDCCDAYKQERDRVFASPEIQAIDAHFAELYSYLTHHSGTEVNDVETAGYLYDTLWIESTHNMTTPDWAVAVLPTYGKPAFPDLLRPLDDVDFGLFGATELQRRLGGGPLLKDMIQHMQYKVDGTLEPPNRKLFIYSGHDTDVACLLTTLQAYNNIAPPLASCVMVELRRSDPDGFFVDLLYRNDTSVEPYRLQLPGCDVSCPWEAFVNLTANVIPDNIYEECKVPGYVNSKTWRNRV